MKAVKSILISIVFIIVALISGGIGIAVVIKVPFGVPFSAFVATSLIFSSAIIFHWSHKVLEGMR